MVEALESAGWGLARIVPYGGESWISEVWRATARDLIVQRAPDENLSRLGVKILQVKVRGRRSCEWALRELLVAAGQTLQNGSGDGLLSLELLYLDRRNQLRGIVGWGPPVLREFVGAIPVVIMEESNLAVGAGPVLPTDNGLESGLSDLLQRQGVHEVQLEAIEPATGFQAILFMATRRQEDTLVGLRVQSVLRELVALLELVLAIEIGVPVESHRSRSRSC